MSPEDSDLDRWPSFSRDVEPLPGGLSALRGRIANEAAPSRARWLWGTGLAGGLAAAGILLWWFAGDAPAPSDQRAATAALLSPANRLPHPAAFALGLAERPRLDQFEDPRLSDNDTDVVFRWVTARPGTLAQAEKVAIVRADALRYQNAPLVPGTAQELAPSAAEQPPPAD